MSHLDAEALARCSSIREKFSNLRREKEETREWLISLCRACKDQCIEECEVKKTFITSIF